MKYIYQFTIIILMSFLGDIVRAIIPLPIPGNVWGMIIMFLLLNTGVIKLSWVDEASNFFTAVLPVFILPLCVGMLSAYSEIISQIIPIIVIGAVSVFVIFMVTGLVAKSMLKLRGAREIKNAGN